MIVFSAEYSVEELDKTAAHILSIAGEIKLFFLSGEPGSGKTSLVASLSKLLGSNAEVTSPTFSIVNEYPSENNQRIYHLDLYRIKSMEELVESGIAELIDGQSYCFVEWPDLLQGVLEYNAVQIDIFYEASHRKLELKYLHKD